MKEEYRRHGMGCDIFFFIKSIFFVFSLAMPPFPPFAAPFGPMGGQGMLFRGAGPARNGPNPGNGAAGGSGRGLPRGFEGAGWPFGGWGGDASWAHQQHRGHMSTPW